MLLPEGSEVGVPWWWSVAGQAEMFVVVEWMRTVVAQCSYSSLMSNICQENCIT